MLSCGTGSLDFLIFFTLDRSPTITLLDSLALEGITLDGKLCEGAIRGLSKTSSVGLYPGGSNNTVYSRSNLPVAQST